jgi:rubrerythrin
MLEEERHTYSVTVWRTETSKRTVTVKVSSEPTQENIIEEVEDKTYNGDYDEIGAIWQTLSSELDTVEIHGEVNRRPISVRKEET